ncbi:hypothetical protein C5S31_08580 [ANME-1 cluster archaeon GoMg2]|nr:hypothetical protein [ANME-1 cluster archaeon GoMg2]
MRRREEVGAKVKLLNCFVLAVVLLSVSALSGAVIGVQGNSQPHGPIPNKIEVISVEPSSGIPADGASVAIIKARAMMDNKPSYNRTLTFQIISEPREGDVYLSTTDPVAPNYGKKVGNMTNEEGYTYATLKAGTVEGDVTIRVYREDTNASDTVVVTLKEQGQPDQFEMSLVEGWNLISIPLQMDNNSINAVFTNASNGDVLYAYEGGWITATYYSGYGWDGDFETIELDKGYWYGANSAYTVTIEGAEAGTRNVSITTGWNLIGYTRLNEASLDDLIPNASNEDVLFAYGEGWITATYYSGYGWDGELSKMEPGKGYWYGANEAFTWEY